MLDDRTRARLATHASAYRASVAATRANDQLTPLGKRAELEKLYNAAKAFATKERGNSEQSEESRKRRLETTLFGLSPAASDSSVVAYRDAQDRVAGISNPEKLGDLMERALIAGDRTLLLAGFSHAYQQSRNPLGGVRWMPMLDEYVREFPATAEPLAELEELTGGAGLTARLGEQMATGITKPPELNHPAPVEDTATGAAAGARLGFG